MDRRHALCLASTLFAAVALAPTARAAQPEISTGLVPGVAVGGFDTVAYFTQNRPVRGNPKISTEWKGAKWHFANQDHLAKFKAAPEAYAPQYGGYSAYGVSQGYVVQGDPNVWKIVDGKLYLNFSDRVQATWLKNIPRYIGRANANWPQVLN